MKPDAQSLPASYPARARERDAWILSRRTPRQGRDPRVPYAFHLEQERSAAGDVVSVATLFLTNRECPWRCLMCDLWQNTLTETVPPGAIPDQIDFALAALRRTVPGLPPPDPPRQVKLYNSGSFFDPRAIPTEDHPAIATRLQSFERIIVESHPSLIGDGVLRFRELLAGPASSNSASPQLEIAMGLETAHPDVLEKLNKQMTLDQFQHAASFLQKHGIPLRSFILVKPPFLDEVEALHWAKRSIDFAFACGTETASLIPTRPGNGAIEALMASGDFSPPRLATLEAAVEYGIHLGHGRVFADLWDLERFCDCTRCFPARRTRLEQMNLRQQVLPTLPCAHCAESENRSAPRR